ncbi:MAG TPA: AsmA-like C-terminal region-containing protein [Puia sp.]
MKKILRYTLRIAGAILCLLLLIWLGLIGYISVKKQSIIQKAGAEIKDRFGADVKVSNFDISFFSHFPSPTLQLSDVSLRDSLWEQHHHDLLQAKKVSVSCALFRSLLKGKLQLGTVFLEQGTIYFYKDSTGYSNTYVLRDRKARDNKGEASDSRLPDITLSEVRWVKEDQDKHKLFDLDVHRLDASIEREKRTLRFEVNTEIVAKNFVFNTTRGSFIKDKKLSGHFQLRYNTASKIIQFQGVRLSIDGHPYVFSGRFFPTVKPDPFFLSIETENVLFHDATSLLTPNLQQKIDVYDIDKPVSIHAQFDAGSADDSQPQIQVRMNLQNGSVLTPIGRFTETSFRASFTNEWVRGRKREDENSAIRLLAFSGRLLNMPLRSDTITITNLKNPRLASDIHSRLGLEQLNDVTGSQTMQFTKGVGNLNVYYKGPLSENDTAGTSVNGRLEIDSAAMTYLPFQFGFTNGKGRLLFKDQDLFIEQLDIDAGKTRIQVKGVAKNLVALLDRNAEDVSMDWNLHAAHLDLEDFIALAGQPSPVKTKSKGQSLFGASFARVDKLLKEGVVHVGIVATDLNYKKFSGAHAKADLTFDNHAIRLNRLNLEQGAGAMDMKATLNRKADGDANPLTVESHLEGVDLPRLFKDFNNFGQEALTARNLKGKLTADIRLSGELTNKARLITSGLKGSVNFSLAQGQLIDFEPMQKIHETVLKKRDMSEIRFAELKNQLDIDSTTLTIHRMEIQSTAFTLFAEGTYDLKKGPDMSLQVPLSNLTRDRNPDILPDSKGNDGNAGLSVRLRARTGDDGKLKISWDPFKKALKKKKGKDK